MKATLQKEDRTTGPQPAPQGFTIPEVNIFEAKDGYVLEAEMPGVSKDGLEITLEGNEITIIGHRAIQPVSGEPLIRECPTTDFRRVFELDPAIDTGKINARINQGLLRVALPKSEAVKPRKIVVND